MTTTLLAYIPSPPQGVWHLGFLPIRAYALCIIAGIIAALVIGDRRWVARGGQPGVVYDVALWAVPFGLIGGRLYHVMTDWPTYFGDEGAGFLAALRIWDGGLGIWGAVALGGVGAWIACRRSGIPLPAFGDAIAPGIVLAQAIGRLGNYFNQELYGRATTLPWGLEIYERRDANNVYDTLNGISTGHLDRVVHPTFLYELLWNLLIFAVLIWVDRRFRIGHGRLFALYVAGYCVGRFWIELMRDDHATEFGGIRVNSFTSTFVFIGAVIYIMVATKGREDPASLAGNDVDDHPKTSLPKKAAARVAAVVGASGVAAASEVADKGDPVTSEVEPETDDGEVAGDAAAEKATDAEAEPETEGLGSTDVDEVAAAVEVAPEADAAIVEEAATAEGLATEVAEDKPQPDAEAGAGLEEAAPEVDDIGSVDGDEVAAAAEAAPEANAAIVEEAAAAEELATEVAESEPEPDSDVEAEAAAEPAVDDIGSVDGDEVAAAVSAAPKIHKAAVKDTAKAEELEDEVAAEADDEADPAKDSDTE